MPVLTNNKHERFAQALARGLSQYDAHGDAGFKAHRGNASKLAQDKSIVVRVAELAADRNRMAVIASEKAAEALSIDRQWVLQRLVANAERAMQERAVEVDGEPTGEYRYEGSVANRALELIGKELGMFIERKEVGKPGEFENLDADQLRQRIAAEAAALGVDGFALEALGRARPAGTKPH